MNTQAYKYTQTYKQKIKEHARFNAVTLQWMQSVTLACKSNVRPKDVKWGTIGFIYSKKKMSVLCAKIFLHVQKKTGWQPPCTLYRMAKLYILASDGLTFDLVLVPSSKLIFQSRGSSGHDQLARRAISNTGVTRRSDWYLNLRFHVNRWRHRSGQWTKCRVLVSGK